MTPSNPHENSSDFGTYEGLRAFGERLTTDTDLRLLAVRHVEGGYALVFEYRGRWHHVVIANADLRDVNSATPDHEALVQRIYRDARRDSTVIDPHAETSVPPDAPAPAPTVVVKAETQAVPDARPSTPSNPPIKTPPKMAGKS